MIVIKKKNLKEHIMFLRYHKPRCPVRKGIQRYDSHLKQWESEVQIFLKE